MLKLLTWPLALAALPAQADTCDAIQAQIEAKLRAGGLTAYSLTTMDQDAPTTGRVVGSCGFGRKKIVYTAVGGPTAAGVPPGTGPAPAPATTTPPRTSAARPADDDIVTECKDGFIGPDCKQRRSPPVTLLPSPAPAPAPAAGTAPAPAPASASTSAPAPASPPASRPPASGAS